MTETQLFKVCIISIFTLFMGACSATESPASDGSETTADASDATESTDASDTTEPAEETQPVFTHKMMRQLDTNPFAALAYECPECTFEQWESIVAPEGWSKGPAQVALFSTADSGSRSYPTYEGHPDTVDFLDEMPGNEYRIIAITLDGRFIGNVAGSLVVEAQVQRDTYLVFKAGMRVHELTDPEGNVFVLFAHHVDPDNWQAVDFQSADALDYFTTPEGWTYSTRILEEELTLDTIDSGGVATVLAVRGDINSTWEKR